MGHPPAGHSLQAWHGKNITALLDNFITSYEVLPDDSFPYYSGIIPDKLDLSKEAIRLIVKSR